MAKRSHGDEKTVLGHIQNVTPKKKTKIGSSHFNMTVQDSPTTTLNVKVFGDDNFKRAQEFQRQRSPVKMKLSYNERFKNHQLADRQRIEKCNNHEVTFAPSENTVSTQEASASAISPTVEKNITEVLEMEMDNTKYISVLGALVLGKEKPSKNKMGMVKDDCRLFDATGDIQIKLWGEEEIKSVRNRGTHHFTYLKLRQDRDGSVFITTSPKTTISSAPDLGIFLPENSTVFPSQIEINVQRIKGLKGIERFYSCSSQACKKKSKVYLRIQKNQ